MKTISSLQFLCSSLFQESPSSIKSSRPEIGLCHKAVVRGSLAYPEDGTGVMDTVREHKRRWYWGHGLVITVLF
uniref:Uncharacterized protein n=1 Tax=Arundo donax TaxID=35708 RepID=A0A0A9E5C8_ARUDO